MSLLKIKPRRPVSIYLRRVLILYRWVIYWLVLIFILPIVPLWSRIFMPTVQYNIGCTYLLNMYDHLVRKCCIDRCRIFIQLSRWSHRYERDILIKLPTVQIHKIQSVIIIAYLIICINIYIYIYAFIQPDLPNHIGL